MNSTIDPVKKLTGSVIQTLLAEKDLGERASLLFFLALFSGKISNAQAKTILLLLARKGETADELLGCVRALLKLEKLTTRHFAGLMDTCGTGGDGSHSLNISTLAALVIAGAGGKVAKHGNRAISSKFGSSDLLEAFGVKLDAPRPRMLRAIRQAGIGYFHAPYYHPVFSKLQPLRRELKRRTILNLLGPLVNPMHLDHQLVGVSRPEVILLYAKVLLKLGRKSAMICHSNDHLDEISTAQKTRIALIRSGKIRMSVIDPEGLGLKPASLNDLKVSSRSQSVRKADRILRGADKGPARDTVILNAAAGLWLIGKARALRDGIRLARHSLDSGKALSALRKLREISRS